MYTTKTRAGRSATYDGEIHMALLIGSLGAEGYTSTDESTAGNNLPQDSVARGSSYDCKTPLLIPGVDGSQHKGTHLWKAGLPVKRQGEVTVQIYDLRRSFIHDVDSEIDLAFAQRHLIRLFR